jgi:hypothetical protein
MKHLSSPELLPRFQHTGLLVSNSIHAGLLSIVDYFLFFIRTLQYFFRITRENQQDSGRKEPPLPLRRRLKQRVAEQAQLACREV